MKTVSKRSILLLFLDLNAIVFSYLAAVYINLGNYGIYYINLPSLFLAMVLFSAMFYIFDLYHPFRRFTRLRSLGDVLLSVSLGGLFFTAISYTDRTFLLSRTIFYYTAGFLVTTAYLVRMTYDFIFRSRYFDKKALVLGTGLLAGEIGKLIKNTPHSGLYVVGFVYEGSRPPRRRKADMPIVGGMKSLLSLIDWYDVDLVIIALEPKEELSEVEIMSRVFAKHVMVTNAIQLFENMSHEIPYRLFGGNYILALISQVKRKPYLKIKRTIDLIFSLALLFIFFPVVVISMLPEIIMERQGPLYFQTRIGKDGRPFQLIKLRTMKKAKNGKQMITKYGKWLRQYRIDEIPQLINVLKGDMSLIGPRPEILYFVERSRKRIPFYDAVFTLKPGLTGWAQVLFCHATSVKDYDKKFRFNLYYLKNVSLSLDLLILVKTVRVVLMGRGK